MGENANNEISIINSGIDYWIREGGKYLGECGQDDEILRIQNFIINLKPKASKDEKEAQANDTNKDAAARFRAILRETLVAFSKLGAKGLDEYNKIMDASLTKGYESAFPQSRGSGIEGFLNFVPARDKMLYLKAGGHKISERAFEYWVEDMFKELAAPGGKYPELKIDPFRKHYELSDISPVIGKEQYAKISTEGYLRSKLDYFFFPNGSLWAPEMKESPFDGNGRTQWRIERK